MCFVLSKPSFYFFMTCTVLQIWKQAKLPLWNIIQIHVAMNLSITSVVFMHASFSFYFHYRQKLCKQIPYHETKTVHRHTKVQNVFSRYMELPAINIVLNIHPSLNLTYILHYGVSIFIYF